MTRGLWPAWTLLLLGMTVACDRDFDQGCGNVPLPEDALALTATPFFQVRRGQVRMRFETQALFDMSLTLDAESQRCPYLLTADADRAARDYAFPDDAVEVERPDVSGDHTLHTATLEQLDDVEPGVAMDWTLLSGPDADSQWSGQVKRPAVDGTSARVLLVGSLAPPAQAMALSAVDDVDLVVLAGDLRSPSVDASTWRQLAYDLTTSQPGALVHTAIGDSEDRNEVSTGQVYNRWFADQGRPGGSERYHALDLAGVRFLMLDGEDDRLASSGSRQFRWVQSELEIVAASDELREAVVVMHRGPHGLTDQVPNEDLRGEFSTLLRDAGVRLVVSGHGHAYQRFDDDGLVVIDVGTGGVPLASPLDERADRDAEGLAKRQVALDETGALVLDVGEGGGLTLGFVSGAGERLDEVVLSD